MRAALGFFLLSAPVLLACSGIMEVVTGKYDLHGPPGADFAAGQGYSQTTTGEFKDGAVTMKVMGQSIQGKMSMRLRESWTLEGLSPTSARVSFREKVTEQKMQMGTERD
ncbi:MAG TPA: hypothetical protein PKW90_08295, partial [Myxococcota bacterium]|nr:hypothetical protein [Myxococcota bacterium]